MIVDCHTHIWEYPRHINAMFMEETKRVYGQKVKLHVDLKEHYEAMKAVDKAIVFGLKAKRIGIDVPNDYVAEYVHTHPEKLIGFASVDPNDPGAVEEFEHAVRDLGLRGLKLGPIYQHFHPHDKIAQPIYAKAQELKVPILIHQGATYPSNAPLEVANPILLEKIALEYPNLKLIIAHMGHPWITETIVLIRKQPNVYADISALYFRPWQFYNAMVLAMEYAVTNKLLFGSDYPFATPESTLVGLKNINHVVEGSNLPKIPEEVINDIIHRNSLEVLNIE